MWLMSGHLASKVIVITGGGSGIGRAVAARVAAEGGAVVIGGRRTGPGEAAAEELRDQGARAIFVQADVTVEAEAAALTEAAMSQFGRLDGAFNNAGGVNSGGPVHDLAEADWRSDLDQNLSSVFFCLKAQIPAMRESGGGSIVANASIGGVRGIGGMAAYVAAKHGVIGLTRCAALENARAGVRVNALVTGNVDTPLYRRLIGAPPEGELAGDAPNPTGRVASAAEIAAFVAFLLSDESAFITGAALPIDGAATA
jgi:NAD(P)-dependent dehydrogenase (short-subunit alcohol dehydrogenase family)